MLSVTFQAAIIIDAANLHSLLSLANTPALVESYAAPEAPAATKRVRTAKATPVDGDKPKRTRATKAEMEARKAAAGGDPAPQTQNPDPVPVDVVEVTKAVVEEEAKAPAPKRDRRSAAQKAKDAEKDAKSSAPKSSAAKTDKSKSSSAADAPDAAAMLERFAKLIDADFEKAKAVLDEFGVNRFSDLKAEQQAAFGAKLTELGV